MGAFKNKKKYYSSAYVLIMLFFQVSVNKAFAQAVHHKLFPIRKKEFREHLSLNYNVGQSMKLAKVDGVLKIRASKKVVVLKDNGEFLEHQYEGNIKGRPLVIVKVMEPNSEMYYLINKEIGEVDTLISKPIFRNQNNFFCFTRTESDEQQKIMLYKLSNNRAILLKKISPDIKVVINKVFWHNADVLYIEDSKQKYYRLIL